MVCGGAAAAGPAVNERAIQGAAQTTAGRSTSEISDDVKTASRNAVDHVDAARDVVARAERKHQRQRTGHGQNRERSLIARLSDGHRAVAAISGVRGQK
jgi:hypothetical protein